MRKKWMGVSVLSLVAGASCGVARETPSDSGDSDMIAKVRSAITDANYTPDTDPNLPNPERGVSYFLGNSVPAEDLSQTLKNHFLYLGGVCATNLTWQGRTGPNSQFTSPVLKEWADAAVGARDAGKKVIFRPRYDSSGAAGMPNGCGKLEGASYTQMQNHVQAIADMLADQEIRPILAFIEMGYLGSWGEWNAGGTVMTNPNRSCHELADMVTGCMANCLTMCRPYAPVLFAASQSEDRITFAKYVIDTYRAKGVFRSVGLRRPQFYKDLEANFSAAPTSMGYYNDCFMYGTANDADGGTFVRPEVDFNPNFPYQPIYPGSIMSSVQAAVDYMHMTQENGAQGGETCVPSGSDEWFTNSASVVPRLDADSFHYLHPGNRTTQPQDFRPKMVQDNRWNDIKTRLGYRYHVKQVDYPMSAAPGGSITIDVHVENTGTAKIPYERRAYLVLASPGGSYVVGETNPKSDSYTLINPSWQENHTVRNWAKGATTIFRQTFPAPTTPGTYTVHAYIPDVDCINNPTCNDTTKKNYAVRLATRRGGSSVFIEDEGNPLKGTNNLGVSFTVTNSSTAVGSITPGNFSVSYDQNSAYFTYMADEFCGGSLEIEKMSLTNGAKTTLLTGGCSTPVQSASDGTTLFYAQLQADDIMKKDVAGTSPPPVFVADAPNVLMSTGIKVDGARVYWADYGAIRSIPKAGGSPTTHFSATFPSIAWLLGIDSTDIYFDTNVTSPCCSYELRKVPIAGGGSTVLHTQNSRHNSLSLQSGNAYFARNDFDGSTYDSTIWRMPVAGGTATQIYSKTSNCVTSMTVNDASLFFTENTTCDLVPGGGRLRQLTNPAGTGSLTTELDGLTGPYAAHLIGTDLFWIDGPQGAKVLRRISTTVAFNSCEGLCGGPGNGCWCDPACSNFGDCCPDFEQVCVAADSCEGRCGGQAPAGCYCDTACVSFGDCCADYSAACP